MVQNFRKAGLRGHEYNFTGQVLVNLAHSLIDTFVAHDIDIWRHPLLLSNLRRLKIAERSYG